MRTKNIDNFQIRVEDENGNIDVILHANVDEKVWLAIRTIKKFCLEVNATLEYNNMNTIEDVIKFINTSHESHIYVEKQKVRGTT